jgi:hypothetical protein
MVARELFFAHQVSGLKALLCLVYSVSQQDYVENLTMSLFSEIDQ